MPAAPTGMRLRYLEWGSGEEVVLLLHDVAECADVWGPVAEKLQQRGYHVFALDHRGAEEPSYLLFLAGVCLACFWSSGLY